MKFKMIFIFLSLCLLGCSEGPRATNTGRWMTSNGKIKVLSTIAMIGDLVEQVGGDKIDNLVLIQGELDPHSYQLVKGDDEKFAYADLIFYNGLNLEHGPSLQRQLRDNKKAIGLGDRLQEQFPELIIEYRGQTDPHIWMDISQWAKVVPFIVEVLSAKDPKNGSFYQANGEKLVQKMNQAHQEVKALLMQIPDNKRYLVTSHDAFNYFARAYLASDTEVLQEQWQDRFNAPEGLAPESQLSTTDIQNIIDHLKKYQIPVLFPESNVSKDSIKKIVSAGKEKGLSLSISPESLYGDAMGPSGSDGDTHIKMIQHNAKTITKFLNSSHP